MWPFRNKPPIIRYGVTTLQVGDECICVDDSPHTETHQKLLAKGQRYTVSLVEVNDGTKHGYGGPFITLRGINPAGNLNWNCKRFEKAINRTSDIIAKVSEPIPGLKEDA